MDTEKLTSLLQSGAKNWNSWRKKNPDIIPDLSEIDLSERLFPEFDFSYMKFSNHYLKKTSFSGTNLQYANFSDSNARLCSFLHADCKWASFRKTHLTDANFRNADLQWTDFSGADLRGTFFSGAILGKTIFGANNLSQTRELDEIECLYECTLGVDTLFLSKGRLPKKFLNNLQCNKQTLSFISEIQKNSDEFCTCFISYSSLDNEFASALKTHLKKKGIKFWFAPDSLRGGENFPIAITNAIAENEKFIVLITNNSLKSKWVKKEVDIALKIESNGRNKIIPLTAVKLSLTKSKWAEKLSQNKHLISFTESHRTGLKKLVQSLRTDFSN